MKNKLALYGGRPVRDSLLPYGHQCIEEDDIKSVSEVLRGNWLTTGPKVKEFEEVFAETVGAKYAISFSSGTAALHGAAYAADFDEGDEVITTPLSFVSTTNCILFQRSIPVFSDIREDTLNINPDEVKKHINSKTCGIIAVDFAGQPCDLNQLLKIRKEQKLILIEDACCALGAEYHGRKIGSISDMTVFSFHPVKNITTGEGGMVTTDNECFAKKLKQFRNHGITSEARERYNQGKWFYEMVDLGYNYRLTDFQSALGISQLSKLSRFLKRREEIANKYISSLREIREITIPTVLPEIKHSWQIFVILLNLNLLKVDRNTIFSALRAENIGVSVHYIPIYMHPYYRKKLKYKGNSLPKSKSIYNRLLTLPIFPTMDDEDVEDVIEAIYKVINHFKIKS